MEEVAGTAEKLAKDKVTTAPPPPPFRQRATQSVYSRIYSEDGKEARNKRAEQRRMRAMGIEKLGEEEYKKLLQEIDRMTQTPVDMQELIDKRMKEIAERLEAEEKEKEVEEQRKTRPGTSKDTIPTTRSSTTRRKPETDTDKTKSGKTDSQPRPKTKQSKQVKIDDASKSRKDKVEKRAKRSKTAAVPLIEDDDDDDLEMIMDKADEIYEPEEDDEEIYKMDDDDDDFQEPPPRSRKTTTSKMPTTKRRVEKSTKKKEDTEDETLALFQRIVGPEFEVRASEEFEDDPKDKYGNPVEAVGFRATMKMLALELKEAVKKGKNIEETYMDLIKSTIEVAKAMKYPGATTVELEDVLKSVKDLKCSAWRKYLKGETRMEPADVELEDEEPEGDLVIQGPILGKEAMTAAAEAIHKLPLMLLADTKRQLKHLFEHTMQAHQHAAEASKCLKELHEQLPLDVFLRIADSAVRPLVVLHVPRTEQIIEKLKETALKRTREQALELKEAVKKGKNIEETYTDLIKSTIEVAKAMKYPGATTVELEDVLKSVKDLKCSAWRKYLKGETRMEPADVELEDEEPEGDLVIQGPILGKEATTAAAEAIHKLPPMLLADTKRQLKHLFEHTMQAHQHAAEASKCLKELHEQLPLDVFLRVADSAVRPLVVLHVPRMEQIIEKLKETALKRTREQKRTGSTEVTDVMVSRNLPQCRKWTAEEEYRPRKMIASIVYKYVREAMFKGNTVTQTIVDEFGLPKTTIHRQLFGKKYPGGGQTLEKLRSQDRKVEATGSGKRKVAVILKKLRTVTEEEPPAKKLKTVTEKEPPVKKTKTITEEDPPSKRVEATGSGKRKPPAKTAKTTTEEEPPSKKGKGPGKKSGKERTAEDIRGAATAESEKRKREVQKRKAQEEEEEFEEDPDKPTKAEIRASKAASKTLFIH